MNPLDDLTLARRAATGDESALAALFGRYGDPLFAFICHQLTKSGQDAKEVWQDTWLAAVRSLASYQGQSGFFTWLGAIARHKIADRYRRAGRNPVGLLSSVSAEQLGKLVDEGPLPEEILQQRMTRIRVVEALATLPDEYRKALIARYADEGSVDEVAKGLGKSYKATESMLSRARAAFRAALTNATGEEHDA